MSARFGSQRPLSTKQVELQAESMLQYQARQRRWAAKAQAQENLAKADLESKRLRNELLRVRQRSARTAATNRTKAERQEIQKRLYASPRRERKGAMYA